MAKPADEQVKASCLAAVLGGMSISKAAQTYGVSRAAVQKWRDQAGMAPVIQPESRDRISEAIGEYLLEALKAMTAHMRLAQDDLWLRRGTATDLANLHGRIGDAVARVVEAAQPAEDALAEPIPIRRAS
jgi:transposase-like protein